MAEARDQQDAWVTRVLRVSIGGSSGADNETAEDEAELGPPPIGMAAWKAARGRAVSVLTSLERAIGGLADPDGDKAIILLRAIRANLTPEPATPQQVAELERYVMTDDIIVEAEDPNGFGFKVELRTPLLAALKSLRDEQAKGARQ